MVDRRVRIVRTPVTPAEYAFADGDLRKHSRLRIEFPEIAKRLARKASMREYPEVWVGGWYPIARQAVEQAVAAIGPDVLVASASPAVSHAVVAAVGQAHSVPYVLDYRDASFFSTITGEREFPSTSPMAKQEADQLDGALEAWFVNDAIRDRYAGEYPNAAARMRVVPNGWDDSAGLRQRKHLEPRDSPLFGYLGTLHATQIPIDATIDAWAGFVLEHPGARMLFKGYGLDPRVAPPGLVERFHSTPGLRHEGPMPRAQVGEFYASVDALLMLIPGGQYMTGGKTMEYLATGLPIVSAHEYDNPLTQLLEPYPLWFKAATIDAAGIRAALEAAAAELRQPDRTRWDAAWEYGAQFARQAILEPRLAVIEEALG
ncbi:MAG: hypothetical protein ACOX61_08845 [Brooklawnia sp.]